MRVAKSKIEEAIKLKPSQDLLNTLKQLLTNIETKYVFSEIINNFSYKCAFVKQI